MIFAFGFNWIAPEAAPSPCPLPSREGGFGSSEEGEFGRSKWVKRKQSEGESVRFFRNENSQNEKRGKFFPVVSGRGRVGLGPSRRLINLSHGFEAVLPRLEIALHFLKEINRAFWIVSFVAVLANLGFQSDNEMIMSNRNIFSDFFFRNLPPAKDANHFFLLLKSIHIAGSGSYTVMITNIPSSGNGAQTTCNGLPAFVLPWTRQLAIGRSAG